MNGQVRINGAWYDAASFSGKGIWRVSDLKGAPEEITVMRVVFEGHAAFSDAKRGIVRPWGGERELTIDSVIAQTSGTRPGTGLTSWSTDRHYSMRLAQPGDIVLMHRARATDAILPPNAVGAESEVLLHGTLRNLRSLRR